MKKIAFILNGKNKKKEKIIKELNTVFKGDYQLAFPASEYPGHATTLAAKAADEGYSYIISIGGDGSLNEVVNGIMQAKNKDNQLNVKVGVLPYGTGNDFIKTIKSPETFEGLKTLIDTDSSKPIDLGLVNFIDHSGKESSRYFINITDIGIGGEAVQKLGKYTKALGSDINYFLAIFDTFLSYRNQPLRAVAEEFTFEGKVKNFVVANGKYYGSGLGVAPDAEVDDGKFAIVILAEATLFEFMKFSVLFRKCERLTHPQIIYYSTKEVKIDSLSTPQLIDMDGEFIGSSPLTLKVIPKTLSFIC